MKTKVLAILLALLISIGGLSFFTFQFVASRPEAIGREVVFEVPSGSFRGVARALYENGLVTDANHFRYLAVIMGFTDKVRVGEYMLKTDMTPLEILRVLTSGKSIAYSVTVQEGKNLYEVAQIIEEKKLGKASDFLKLCRDTNLIRELLGEPLPSLEGYLFPNTYSVTKYTGLRKLIQMMVEQFKTEYDAKVKPLSDQAGWKRHQTVIMASIVEKETGAVDERKLVSSVYHNRLKKRMRLQADPTVLYGIWFETGKYRENIKREDLSHFNSYNTYAKEGLPSGPIANPGLLALQAAVSPASSPYLFFVSRNDGTHKFSETYAEHEKAVRSFQLDPKARQGKSWRDLNRRQSDSKN